MMTLFFLLAWFGFTIGMSLWIEGLYFIPLWFVLGYGVGLLVVILLLVIHLPIMLLTKPTNWYKYYVTKSASKFINRFIFNISLKVEGLGNIPKDGILTIYANHKSYADPIIVLAFMNRSTTFTPKMSVYKAPFIGAWLKSLASFPIDRSSDRNTAKALVEAIKTVKTGMVMTIFPEGGIKDRNEEKMVDMRAGAYKLATKAQANLLPIRIIGTTEIKNRAPLRHTKIKVIIYPVINYSDVASLSTTEIADLVFKQINQ